jgi:hypothetical protein
LKEIDKSLAAFAAVAYRNLRSICLYYQMTLPRVNK